MVLPNRTENKHYGYDFISMSSPLNILKKLYFYEIFKNKSCLKHTINLLN